MSEAAESQTDSLLGGETPSGDQMPSDEQTSSTDENPNGETDSAESTSDQKDSDSKEETEKPLEDYADFVAPEGMELDEKVLEEATVLFKDMKLSQEQAQQLVDFQAKQVQAITQGQVDSFIQMKEDWAEKSKADSEIGGDKLDESLKSGKLALEKFGTPELMTLMNDFGIGNHPEVIRFMAKVGRLTNEDSPGQTGNPVGKSKTRVEVLYPND